MEAHSRVAACLGGTHARMRTPHGRSARLHISITASSIKHRQRVNLDTKYADETVISRAHVCYAVALRHKHDVLMDSQLRGGGARG